MPDSKHRKFYGLRCPQSDESGHSTRYSDQKIHMDGFRVYQDCGTGARVHTSVQGARYFLSYEVGRIYPQSLVRMSF